MYWKGNPDYWKLTEPGKRTNYSISHYPLSFRDRLYQGHYLDFDDKGIPMFHARSGKLVHFCTGMCSFAFAHWEEFLNTGDKTHAEHVVKVADYLLGMAETRDNGALMLLDYDSDDGDNGVTCAMNQGESISAVCRAYSYTGKQIYLDAALKMAIPFGYEYGQDGVRGKLPNNEYWYLEGGKMILNGHNYTLFGLNDLYTISSEQWVKDHLDTGIASLIKSINLFDNGYWSWYWVNKPLYIASAMYHNLHICQLQALAKLSGHDKLQQYALRFANYAQSPVKRGRAAMTMLQAKIAKKSG